MSLLLKVSSCARFVLYTCVVAAAYCSVESSTARSVVFLLLVLTVVLPFEMLSRRKRLDYNLSLITFQVVHVGFSATALIIGWIVWPKLVGNGPFLAAFWSPFVLGTLCLLIATLASSLVRYLRPALNVAACSECGYDLRGLVDTAVCPECGRDISRGEWPDLRS